ncbi:PQQ-dependent sugar dehydrogenase [Haloferula chungangensis]|uniref:PQQ-dependent sugar dehydrogenase n=1 Tax=Haloferula chungangensis TaxID=1048331 RepID=A0ABW2L941_9BACT
MKPLRSPKLSALCILAVPLNAATIDWTSSDISSVSEVDTSGTLVTAQNFAGTGAPSVVTLAGIDFTENNSLTSDHSGDFFAFVTGDAAYDEFLGDLDFTPNAETFVTIPLSVETGASYRVQVWYADDGGFGSNPQRTMTLSGTGDRVLNGNDYAIGTFTADSTNQDLVIISSREGVRLTGYQLRKLSGPPVGPVTVADAAADYTGPNSLPAGWQYFKSTAASGGSEVALAANQPVGNSGNVGFGGGGALDSASILGSGSPYQLYTGAGHGGVAGSDLLIQPGNNSDDAFIIARYTISATDFAGGSSATVSGSFRDLQGGANDSVAVSVYHNSTSLFSATGSAGRLYADGSSPSGIFDISGITVAEGDTISFVVGNNGNYGGDETALQASIVVDGSLPGVVDDFFNVLTASTTDLDVLANDLVGTGGNALAPSTLRITSLPSLGTAERQPNGTLRYIHGGTEGADSFEYAVDHSDGDTTYTGRVDILANNGTKVANSSLNFSEQPPSGGWQFPNAFPGLSFSQGTCLETIPGNPQALVITERAGRIQLIQDVTAATPSKSLFLDISGETRTQTFCGLRGVAFHPDFANNRYFYVGYDRENGSNDTVRVSRFTANASNLSQVNAATELVLFENPSNQNIHRINRLAFGPDGYLYIAVGDDGNFTGPANTQRIDDGFWSSVLRIDVDKKPGNHEPANTDGVHLDGMGKAYYSVPADNPFVDPNFSDGRGVTTFNGQATPTSDPWQVRTEMYAVGFRNPWKIGFVPDSGELWVADDGAHGYEKISIMPRGGNAGWGYFEGTDPGVLQMGTTQYPGPLSEPPAGVDFVQPVLEYKKPGNTSGSGVKSIIGGTFYQGTAIAELTGAFVFADYTKGDIWYFKRPDNSAHQLVQRVAVGNDWGLDESGMVTKVISESSAFQAKSYGVSSIVRLGTEGGITAMIGDPSDGSILMLDYSDGIIRRLEFNIDDASLPQTLTETGAFSNLANLTPNAGVHPYDLNLRFWSDHADKTRFFAVDDLLDTIAYSQDGLWEAPAGAVWIKHFDMDLNRDNPGTKVKRLETRFLVKTEKDFYGVSYRWNEAGTEADLVASEGEDFDLTITEGGSNHRQTWRIPSRGDCRTCHTNDNKVMLGFNTRQLNLDGTLSGNTDNFIKLLKESGYLSSPTGLPDDFENLPKYHASDDISANLEERARSYLAVNCSYCHYEGSSVVPNSWSGEPQLTIEQTKLLHGEGVGFSVVEPTDRLVIPGNTAKSMILSLTSHTNGYNRMPPLATDIVDQEGVALLTDWINHYANAKPALDATAGPFTVVENAPAVSPVGSGPQVSDPDDPSRGTLTFSIIGGNDGGYFDIDPSTGEITVVRDGLDYEETTSRTLVVLASDGFAPNPGEVTSDVVVDITDIAGDDSQGDGIEDEWALTHLGSSKIDPNGDTDKDGSAELLEFWADSDPNDPTSRGLVIAPYDVDRTSGSEGYLFEWAIRSDLAIGTDYFVQGSVDLNFTSLNQGSDFVIISSDPVDNGSGPALSRLRVKVPTTSARCFLRLSSKSE